MKLAVLLIICTCLLIQEGESYRLPSAVFRHNRRQWKKFSNLIHPSHVPKIQSTSHTVESQFTTTVPSKSTIYKKSLITSLSKNICMWACCICYTAKKAIASESLILSPNANPKLNPLHGLLIWVILFMISAIMHCAESSITKISPYKVQEFAEQEGPTSPFATLHQNLTRLLITMLLTTTACSIYSTALFVTSLSALFPRVHLGVITVTLTILTLFFEELLPKALAVSNSEYYARMLLPPLSKISFLFTPLTSVISFFSDSIFKSLGMHDMTSSSNASNNVSEDMLRMVIHEAQQSKEGIASSEGRMMNAVLDMQDTEVNRIMCPRIEIIGVPESLCVSELISMAVLTKYSRIPVYKDNIDHITGVIFTKDLLHFIQKTTSSTGSENVNNDLINDNRKEIASVIGADNTRRRSKLRPSNHSKHPISGEFLSAKDIAKPAFFIPETMSCWNALQEMRKRHVHIAIVVDEYGGTSGLVTLEDILEEVIGEIYDEDDSHREELFNKQSNQWTIIRKQPPGPNSQVLFLMKGYAELDDVCEALQIPSFETALEGQLKHCANQLNINGEYTTLGGLLCCLMGKIPSEGDQVEFANYLFTVVKVEEARRIVDVIVQPIVKANNSGAQHVETDEGSKESFETKVQSGEVILNHSNVHVEANVSSDDAHILTSHYQQNSNSSISTWISSTVLSENAGQLSSNDLSLLATSEEPFCGLVSTDKSINSPAIASSFTMISNQHHEKYLLFRDGEWVDPKEEFRR